MAADNKNKTTIATLNRYKQEKIKAVFVSAYDFWQAQLCNKAGVDGILVGDSMGMTTLGYENTLPVTMDAMILHMEAVKRGNTDCYLIGDMPYASFIDDYDAVYNASRFMIAGADGIKLEGFCPARVQAVSKAGISVMGHLGLTPQTRAKLGGYRVQGKTKKDVDVILEQAKVLEDNGCSSILFEAVPNETSQFIAEQLSIPCYGIGAGNNDALAGQLIIFHDLVGLFFEFKSKFVKRYCEAGLIIQDALREYASEVRTGLFPAKENFYEIKEKELEKLLGDNRWKYELTGKNECLGTSPGC